MGSMIGIGEKHNDFHCYVCDGDRGGSSDINLSASIRQRFKEILIHHISDEHAIEALKGIQSDEYLKAMHYIQKEHSENYGLSDDKIENLVESLSEHIGPKNNVAEEEERKLRLCIAQENSISKCHPLAVAYLQALEKARIPARPKYEKYLSV